ncbi:hypothetical protein QEZ52_13785 [Aliisedimentitalea scapharcae]|uniref:Uncharacterized protein n=1 Tax=Aliisedimentitalea scapharcae TaxID=1524259 RepID=A0ABZ2XNM8_9RHOB|nr:hypothetical protein K3727_13690 [Rhodobacteraceae bacterium M382]
MSNLDARLLDAHAAKDEWALVRLYCEAADSATDEDAAWFFLTQAYVFALEQNHPDLEPLRARLVAGGREST